MPRTPHISPLSLRPLTLAVALLLLCLTSCTRVQSIREARTIVAEADSLRTAGVPYTDSTAMADAAATLQRVHLIYPTAYAHANYYYGRILRDHNNHPEAMLAFLRVVHSRTPDHAIKGRTYCNMGIMCGLAVEHDLAYDMYEHSAEEFLLAEDTIAYYYALIDMAFERAENRNKEEAIGLSNRIEDECPDYYVTTKIWETRAYAYLYAEQYDSTIYCVNKLLSRGCYEPSGLLLKAKAFSFLSVKDSAVFYAKKALTLSQSLFDINNAYYILSNDDDNNTKEEALQIAGDRADVQKLIEIRQGQLSQATQLLEQDLSRKPDLRWLFAVLLTLAVIGIALSMYLKRKRRKHQLISQQVDNLRQEQAVLSSQTQHLKSVNTEYEAQVKHNITLFCQKVLTSSNPQESLSWNNYEKMRRIINENAFGLADKLEDLGLAEHEIRFCVLVLLGFDRKKSAEWMRLGVSSIGGKKRDIAIKLGQKSARLYDYLLSLALK